MRCGKGERISGLFEGATLHYWKRRTWIGRKYGVVALQETRCHRRWGNSGACPLPISRRHTGTHSPFRRADVHTITTLTDNTPSRLQSGIDIVVYPCN